MCHHGACVLQHTLVCHNFVRLFLLHFSVLCVLFFFHSSILLFLFSIFQWVFAATDWCWCCCQCRRAAVVVVVVVECVSAFHVLVCETRAVYLYVFFSFSFRFVAILASAVVSNTFPWCIVVGLFHGTCARISFEFKRAQCA